MSVSGVGRSFGEIVDQLGVESDPPFDDTQLVSDAIVLIKQVDPDDGRVSLFLASSPSLSWIEQIGMLRAAERIANGEFERD